MSSVLPGCGVLSSESSRGRRPLDDTELPRRKSDNELRRSDDVELLFECAVMWGVPGGVMAPLSCNMRTSCVPMVDERRLVGDAGGVDRVRATSGFGTARLYSRPNVLSVRTWSCGGCLFSVAIVGGDVNLDGSSLESGNVNRGSSAISFPRESVT
jgi:hypothetical protein